VLPATTSGDHWWRTTPTALCASGLAALALALVAVLAAPAAHAAPACDRACLEARVDRFPGMPPIAHDPGKVPFDRNIKYTENGVKLLGRWHLAHADVAWRLAHDGG
jgi:hypothetical protein